MPNCRVGLTGRVANFNWLGRTKFPRHLGNTWLRPTINNLITLSDKERSDYSDDTVKTL